MIKGRDFVIFLSRSPKLGIVYTTAAPAVILFFSAYPLLQSIISRTTMMPPRVLASGPKPCGGNNFAVTRNEILQLFYYHKHKHKDKAKRTKHRAQSAKRKTQSTMRKDQMAKRKSQSTKRKSKSTNHNAESGKHKAQSANRKAQSAKHKAQITNHKAQSTKHKAQSTKLKAQSAKRNWNFRRHIFSSVSGKSIKDLLLKGNVTFFDLSHWLNLFLGI